MTPREMTLQEIDAIVADYGFTHREILQRWGQGGRNPKLLAARKQCAVRLMMNGLTLTQTARAMDRDHSTIRYYLGRV
jgi:DNA-binding CsgD family transcriptional regulator